MNRLASLSGIAATLLIISLLNMWWLDRPLDLSPVPAKPIPAVDLEDIGQAPEGNLPELDAGGAEALLRPLFHVNRRPFTPTVTEISALAEAAIQPAKTVAEKVAPTEVRARPDLILTGVSLTGATRQVLLGASSGAEMRWYSEGETVAGWSVASIAKDAVTLSKGQQRFRLALYPPLTSVEGEH